MNPSVLAIADLQSVLFAISIVNGVRKGNITNSEVITALDWAVQILSTERSMLIAEPLDAGLQSAYLEGLQAAKDRLLKTYITIAETMPDLTPDGP